MIFLNIKVTIELHGCGIGGVAGPRLIVAVDQVFIPNRCIIHHLSQAVFFMSCVSGLAVSSVLQVVNVSGKTD